MIPLLLCFGGVLLNLGIRKLGKYMPCFFLRGSMEGTQAVDPNKLG